MVYISWVLNDLLRQIYVQVTLKTRIAVSSQRIDSLSSLFSVSLLGDSISLSRSRTLVLDTEMFFRRSVVVFLCSAVFEHFRNMTSTCSSSFPESINCERYYNQSKFSSYPGGGEVAI